MKITEKSEKPAELSENDLNGVTGGAMSFYIVKAGETLQDISCFLGVSVSTLVSLNNITNPDLIYAGTKLRYPS